MINYKIRPYQESDAKHVALLSKELGYLATSSDVERRFAILLKYTAIHGIFVAQLGVNIIGWIHVYGVHLLESDGYAEIGGLVVSQLHRKQGIGKELVQQAEEMTSTDVSTFPGEYTNPNFSRGAILPILQGATPQKYTTPLQYMLHFSGSLTEVDIKKCDALYPVTISYSGSQVFFAPPDSSIEYSKYLKAAKNRASCYAQVIR